ncbi:MAG: isochorismatase [Myxococcales bacterium]|nr:isochorismatase [Myxococcales bacterium]|tara:strand:- start:325 stop:924 length:600 start_codon:yes stop_codon:yes gene_type:complete
MESAKTAVIMVGYQNDYFAEDGILRGVIEESDRTNRVMENSLALVDTLKDTDAVLIQTPIIFTEDYRELVNPVGILKAIQDVKAFRAGTSGAEVVSSFKSYGDRIVTVEGKRGLNAFSNTELDEVLEKNGVEHVVLAGAVTSICIDSTGRAAHERNYRVSVLSDCTASRTPLEQEFYCENVFPLYADVITSNELLAQLA